MSLYLLFITVEMIKRSLLTFRNICKYFCSFIQMFLFTTNPQALDGNFVKVLYIIKCQSVLYLSVKFQVDRPGNERVTIYSPALA